MKLPGSLLAALCIQSLLSVLPVSAELALDQAAPDFSLPSADGKTCSLSEFRDKKVVVVYFYPKDETGVCTRESCSFRDRYQDFKEAGAEVIGVSGDSVESHKGFAAHHKLPFILLSDSQGKLRKLWQVPNTLGFPGRVTYVVDKQGKVRMVFNSAFDAEKHVDKAVEMVKKLSQGGK